MPSKVLLTMDDLETAVRINAALEGAGYRTVMVSTHDDARGALRRETPDLVILTGAVHEPPVRQLAAQARDAEITTVALLEATDPVGAEREQTVVDVTELVIKPVVPSEMVHLVERLIERRRLQQRTGIIGESAAIQELLVRIEQMAPVSSTVLIQGESGTGKELVAKAIHDLSPRRGKPFIAVNCAALPETLLESELFGHEKGAFTGAVKTTEGKIELANGGTLFLDEVGDIPLPLQVKLLRFLQERTIERIGGRKSIDVDTRIVCATHQDLEAMIAEGRFREDLFYRLAEIVVKIPS
ncbi:MAG TPA: sigma 54-interacting transcriptional regulator, partial [Gemmatimonadales bacterium]|nr:sigma 54-interacting transcriptional regulator [Gemmatimonadales bacterium]